MLRLYPGKGSILNEEIQIQISISLKHLENVTFVSRPREVGNEADR